MKKSWQNGCIIKPDYTEIKEMNYELHKIGVNINQIAKMVNGQKFISENELHKFSNQLTEIAKLKAQQNEVFLKIYSMLGK